MLPKNLILFMLGWCYVAIAEAQNYPTDSWRINAETSWYNENIDEFNISTAEQLAGLSKLVEQGNSFINRTINIISDINLDNYLWVPIGYDDDSPFSGVVQGNNHTISNLWITGMNRDFLGLFGQTTEASFYDLKIQNVNIDDIGSHSGVLVASMNANGIIDNCHATNVDIKVLGANIGGLNGRAFTNSHIENSSFTGRVEGIKQIGGLSAFVWDNSKVLKSFSKGEVHGKYIVGGLIGFGTTPFEENREVIIENSYSRAHVFATDIFGKAGGIYGWAPATVILKNVYATGRVTGLNSIGALVGQSRGILIENSFFDMQTSQLTVPIGKHDGPEQEIEGRQTSEMTTNSFTNILNGNTFDDPWVQDSHVNNGYPYLGERTLSMENIIPEQLTLKLYPIPVHQEFFIYSTIELTSYNIYNILGQHVASGKLYDGPEYKISASNLKSGVHIIELQNNTLTLSRKFIKR